MLSGGKSGDRFKGLPIAILSSAGIQRQWVEVEDQGVLAHIDSIDEEIVDSHNQQIFRPFLRIRLEKETSFMGGRMKLLLKQIDETHSVREACAHIPVSYSQAWTMLNRLEKELGFEVVVRRHGGRNGGKTGLTHAGREFLKKYCEFEAHVRQYAAAEFERIFKD